MKLLIKKIAKPIAIGIFFMALFFNVKVSLENPFIRLDNAALAQTSSSSSDWPDWVCCQSQSTGCFSKDGSMYFPTDYVYYGQTCP